MKVTVCRPRDLSPAELQCWRDLQAGDPRMGHPFLSPEFALAVDEVLDTSRVGVVEHDSTICGFWPFSLGRGRVAGPIAPGCTDAEGVVRAPGGDWDAGDLVEACGLNGWRFTHLLAGQVPATARGVSRADSLAVDLTGGWDHYLEDRRAEHKTRVSKHESSVRRMARRHEVTVEVGTDAAVLDALMDMKSAQCRDRGWKDVFAPGWIRDLKHLLLAGDGGALRGIVVAIRADDDIAAGLFDLRTGPIEAIWLAVFNAGYGSFSPGTMAFMSGIEAAAAAGVGIVDLGKGNEPFKQWISNSGLPIAAGYQPATTVSGRALAAAAVPPQAMRSFLERRPRLEAKAERAVQGARRRLAGAAGQGFGPRARAGTVTSAPR